MKSSKMGWTGHLASMGKRSAVYRIFVKKKLTRK
jgi:hypothetical protein